MLINYLDYMEKMESEENRMDQFDDLGKSRSLIHELIRNMQFKSLLALKTIASPD